MEQFPMFRLATLLARQLSSPIAARIKGYAKTHPRFSRVVCAGVARRYGAAELALTRLALQLAHGPRAAGLARAPPLSDAEAIAVGGDILGEAVIFALGSLIIVFEVNRQAAKQETKVLEERSQWAALLAALEELQRELMLQQRDIDRLHAALRDVAPGAAPPAPPAPSAAG